MTHRDVTLYPSPGLNFILGPNGSGKSSIVVALFLALNGKLKVRELCAYALFHDSLVTFLATGPETHAHTG